MLFGFDIAIITGAGPFLESHFRLSHLSLGWAFSSLLFGCVIGSAFAGRLTDLYGRKPLYIVGSLGMTIALSLLVVTVLMDRFQGLLVLGLVLLFLAFFASCIGPVFWTLVPEIFPNRIRGTAMIVPVLTQWVANAVVVLFFPFAFHAIGKAPTFAFLASMSLLQAIFAWRFVPETKCKTLEEIEKYWNTVRRTEKRTVKQD